MSSSPVGLRNTLPLPSGIFYTELNFASLTVILAGSALVAAQPEGQWFAAAVIAAALLVLAFWISPLLAEPVPEDVAKKILHKVGSAANKVAFKKSRSHDFQARNALFRNVCFVPARVWQQANTLENARALQEASVLVAHEIAHLVSGDSRKFQLCTAGLFLAATAAICTSITLYRHEGRIIGHTISGLMLASAVMLFLLYQAIRAREYVADRYAADLAEHDQVSTFLIRMKKLEPYISFPIWYRLTHPTFSERYNAIDNFYSLYTSNLIHFLYIGLLLGFVIAAFPLGAFALRNVAGDFAMYIFVVIGAILPFYLVVRVMFPAVVTCRVSFLGAMGRAALLYAASIAAFFLWSFIVFGSSPSEIRASWGGGEDRISQMLGDDPWQRMLNPAISFLAAHFVIYMGGRWIIMFRGEKALGRFFFAKAALSVGLLSTAMAGIAANLSLSAVQEWPDLLGIYGAVIIFAAVPWTLMVRGVVGGRERGDRGKAEFMWFEWDSRSDKQQLRAEQTMAARRFGCGTFAVTVVGYTCIGAFLGPLIFSGALPIGLGSDMFAGALAGFIAGILGGLILMVSRRT